MHTGAGDSSARVKYPRTPHHPSSPGFTSDDLTMRSLPVPLRDCPDVIVTLKLDGESTTGYSDGYVHARSIDSAFHPSRSWVQNRLAPVLPSLPEGWRVCGENLYAVHSIEYGPEHDLPDLIAVYSLWDESNRCLDWDTTVEWCDLLGLATVPVIYRGPVPSAGELDRLFAPYAGLHEGWVLRTVAGFEYDEFGRHVVKWVRANHVTTDQHWSRGPVRRNWARLGNG